MIIQRPVLRRLSTTYRQMLPILPVTIKARLPPLSPSTLTHMGLLRLNRQLLHRTTLSVTTRSGRRPKRVNLTRMLNRPYHIVQRRVNATIRARSGRPIVRKLTVTLVITGRLSFTTHLKRRHNLTRLFIRMTLIRLSTQLNPTNMGQIQPRFRLSDLLTRNLTILSRRARKNVLITTLLNRTMINRRTRPRPLARNVSHLRVSRTRTRTLLRNHLIRSFAIRRNPERHRSLHPQNSVRRNQTTRLLEPNTTVRNNQFIKHNRHTHARRPNTGRWDSARESISIPGPHNAVTRPRITSPVSHAPPNTCHPRD